MSVRVGKGLIAVLSLQEIEWYRPRSVRMPVASSSQQFESTCPGNTSRKVCIPMRPVVGQERDRLGWNPPVEGNRIIRFRSFRMAIEVSRMTKADPSGGRRLPESGRVSLKPLGVRNRRV